MRKLYVLSIGFALVHCGVTADSCLRSVGSAKSGYSVSTAARWPGFHDADGHPQTAGMHRFHHSSSLLRDVWVFQSSGLRGNQK